MLKPDTKVKIKLISLIDGVTDFDTMEIWITETSIGVP